MYRILIVEDDADIRKVLRALLEQHGYRVVEAENANRALIAARSSKPDLMLVDLGLPDAEGSTVIQRVRSWSAVPIVVLSARAQEEQKIAALDAGADDYVTKPFSAPELLARVRAGVRRNAQSADRSQVIEVGNVRIDLGRRDARGEEGEIHLTPLEYRVLETLARQTGMIVRQQQLIAQVWGPDRQDDSRNLRVSIRNLRHKLEPDPQRPRYLVTEPGVGYRLRLNS